MTARGVTWTSALGFVLAMAGSAIGMGNFWRFSYVLGRHGGGAFLLVYLGACLCIGLPVLACEFAIGRRGGCNAVEAMPRVAGDARGLIRVLALLAFAGALLLLCKGFFLLAALLALLALAYWRHGWTAFGLLMSVLTPLAIMAFYSVVGGWIISYLLLAAKGQLAVSDAAATQALMETVLANKGAGPSGLVISSLAYFALSVLVIVLGVNKGIERCSKIFIPLVFLLLLAVIVRCLALPGALEGLKFLFVPDFSKLDNEAFLAAIGQAFFTISAGAGIGLAYGSYLRKDTSILGTTATIILMDTLASLLAGLAIFPVVFACGLSPAEGPTLVFSVLPLAFSTLPFPAVWSTIFFLALLLAALTSSMSLLEPATQALSEKLGIARTKALALVVPVPAALLVLTALSPLDYARVPWLGDFVSRCLKFPADSLFTLLDTLACSWLMPLSGLVILLFVSFTWGRESFVEELRRHHVKSDSRLPGIVAFLVRYVSPALVALAFLHGLGVL